MIELVCLVLMILGLYKLAELLIIGLVRFAVWLDLRDARRNPGHRR